VRAPAATDGTEPVGVVDDRDKLINYWTSNFFFFFVLVAVEEDVNSKKKRRKPTG